MPYASTSKYYVSSGNMNVVILGENPSDAILRALTYIITTHGTNDGELEDIELEPEFQVSEKGFRSDDSESFSTDDILSGLDWNWEDNS